jgi:pyruvate kinase
MRSMTEARMNRASSVEASVVRARAIEAAELDRLIAELTAMRADMIGLGAQFLRDDGSVHPSHRESARNLLHYVALRRRDRRTLQVRLAALGLSSLGRAESHVLSNVDTVLRALHAMANQTWSAGEDGFVALDAAAGKRLLDAHSEAILGPEHDARGVRIMVTMPSEAAHDEMLVQRMLEAGMDCMRINCAHDGPEAWSDMIEHLRRAEHALGRRARVLMDLAGPKLRTGPVEPGPAVVKLRPSRDALGRVTAPARVWLTSLENPFAAPSPADAALPLRASWLADLAVGNRIHFVDARGSSRKLRVVETSARGAWAECDDSAYVVPGTLLRRRKERDGARVGELPPNESSIPLCNGDQLVLTRDLEPGSAATYDAIGRVLTPARIGCTLPEVFDDVREGEHVWFDDGKIGGVIERAAQDELSIRIVRARPRGEKLRANKGINLPDSELHTAALTEKDVEDLQFVARHADIVGLSFASRPEDVTALQQHLERIGGAGGKIPGILIKLETRRAFDHLPEMLLAAMSTTASGVMIARGDLAVECGYERLAEVQEEILWMCEAAHLPVVWATQVLETLARNGTPSRAEITDAAMSHRSECVMLNKGPYIVDAIRVLDDILRRMREHQSKKQSMLRELRLARVFTPPSNGRPH